MSYRNYDSSAGTLGPVLPDMYSIVSYLRHCDRTLVYNYKICKKKWFGIICKIYLLLSDLEVSFASIQLATLTEANRRGREKEREANGDSCCFVVSVFSQKSGDEQHQYDDATFVQLQWRHLRLI